MSLAQLHYTSASAGDDGVGARFTAVGGGIPTPVLTEAEKLLGYEPPAGAPYHPTNIELRSFPETFSFSELSDGSHLLSRTVALGGSGAGHFHTHAVHLPAGTRLPGDALPITAWRSPSWASTTPDSGTPDRISALPASAAFGQEALNDFAVSRSPWLATVFADLRRVSEKPSSAQLVLVERQSADVARWIALAGAVLPPEHAQRLTFTTYTRRPAHSPHQVIGVLPDDAHELTDLGFRVHLCAGRVPEGPVADTWAETVARVWRSRAPELFQAAAALPGEPFAAGPLAFTALHAGIALGRNGRAAAADWAGERPYALNEQQMHRLTTALTAPADDRSASESASVARLLAALEGRAPATTTAPLAALLVTEAVRRNDAALALPPRSAFAEPAAVKQLADGLGPELLAELTPEATESTSGESIGRLVQLLRIARLLDMDLTDRLPSVARHMARTLLASPEPDSVPVLLDLLDEQFDVRTALLGELDQLALGAPSAVEELLTRVALPFTGAQALPHLRMCAEAPRAKEQGSDRIMALHTVLRAAGFSPFAEPLVLRTAVALIWGDATPTAGEARLLLGESGSDSHRTAGTWSHLVDAALHAPSDDEEAAELAHDLLRCFPQEIGTRVRGALQLLDFARDVRSGESAPGWPDRAKALRSRAEPVEPTVLEHAYGALAHRLLARDRPDAELYAFVHSDDADLIAAYGRAARHGDILARLRSDPAYVADCFTVWSAHPHAGRAWSDTRAALLEEVLRPVVRGLSSSEVTAVEKAVEYTGSSRTAEAFREWNRPTTFGRRLGSRLTARVRRKDESV
ncbi:GTPase-associated protein 1-related protein [Streptomyces sp. NPDC051286]|uniref:GTPase-associated protein 1-related protein n=1 Tax=Streptomyces sp. NPDC051286 TaxID=3365647 RepID=UPI003797E99B